MKRHHPAVIESVWRRLPKPSKKTITGIRTRERLVALAWLRLLVAITNQ